MAKKTKIDYESLVQESLRKVIHEVLVLTAKNGLIDNHHFYISYRTDFPGVDLPDYLKEEYPEEITIVLQYEFWDLEVENDRFYVTLCFNDIHERLAVPLAAITSFVDPSVKFGLQFDHEIAERELPKELPVGKKRGRKKTPVDLAQEENESTSSESNVIALDTFRKK